MSCRVTWGTEISREFAVPLGIKQGGINSPDFFGVYFDDLVQLLRQLQIGCHMLGLFLAVLLFADDLVLMAPTRSALNKLIDNCSIYCKKFGLSFNAKKSKVMIFSKNTVTYDSIKPVSLDGLSLEYTNNVTYLGTTIVSEKGFTFSCNNDLVKFCRASNSILTAVEKPSEEIVLQLLYTNCIPTLTYACAIKTYTSKQMQNCNTAVNDALRRIFGYNRWESIRVLRDSFGYKSITDIFGRARRKFYTVLPYHSNSIVSRIARNLPDIVEQFVVEGCLHSLSLHR